MLRRSITCLLAVGAVSALLTLSPPTAHAIPVAGDYVFTSGLTGTFTSTGTSLSAWNFGEVGSVLVYNNTNGSQIVNLNNALQFRAAINPSIQEIEINWNPLSAPGQAGIVDYQNGGQVRPYIYTYTPVTAVPEPPTVVLQGLALAVLALMGSIRRQRHQAGLQVG